MSRPIRLESRTEEEARCIIEVLEGHAPRGPYELEGVWIVEVAADPETDDVLEAVINAVLACYADGRINGFTLDAEGHRIPVGFAPSPRVTPRP